MRYNTLLFLIVLGIFIGETTIGLATSPGTCFVIQMHTQYKFEKTSIVYYDNEVVKEGILADNAVIGYSGSKKVKSKVILKSGEKITFYPSGMIATAVLAQNCQIGFHNDRKFGFRAGSGIQFYDYLKIHNDPFAIHYDIKVKEGVLARSTRFKLDGNLINLSVGTKVMFDEDQSFQFQLQADTHYKVREDRILFKTGVVVFGREGWVKEGVLAEDSLIPIVITGKRQLAKFKAGTKVVFTDNQYCKGRIVSGTLAEDTTVKVGERQLNFAAGSAIRFYEPMGTSFWGPEHRIVFQGTLAEDTVFKVNGESVVKKKGSTVKFDKRGNLSSI